MSKYCLSVIVADLWRIWGRISCGGEGWSRDWHSIIGQFNLVWPRLPGDELHLTCFRAESWLNLKHRMWTENFTYKKSVLSHKRLLLPQTKINSIPYWRRASQMVQLLWQQPCPDRQHPLIWQSHPDLCQQSSLTKTQQKCKVRTRDLNELTLVKKGRKRLFQMFHYMMAEIKSPMTGKYILSPRPVTLILLRSSVGATATLKGLLGMWSPP